MSNDFGIVPEGSRPRRIPAMRCERGGAMVELGLTLPLLLILCMAAGDFARIFYHALSAQGASANAAFFGVQTNGSTGDFGGMEQRATDDAGPLRSVEATATQWCGCPDGSSFPCIEYSVRTCVGYGAPLAYVRVEVNEEFTTLGNYYAIPHRSQIRQQSWMRVR